MKGKLQFEVIDAVSGKPIAKTFEQFCQAGLIAAQKGFPLHVKDAEKDFLFRVKGKGFILEFNAESLKKKKK